MGTRAQRARVRGSLHLPGWPKPKRVRSRPSVTQVLVIGGVGFGCILLAALLTGTVYLPGPLSLPPAALVAVVMALASVPLFLTRWKVGLALFFVWLPFEDLIRKMAGNDLHVYFVKDFLYVLVMIGMFADPSTQGAWKRATGRARLTLYVLIAWAVALSVPSALQDWRLPLLGLRFDFFYAPLVVAGFVLGQQRDTLLRWLLGLSIMGAAQSAVGIAQAVIGPSFLAPTKLTPGLIHLVTVKGLPGASEVFRPTGFFVDPGRFASMVNVAFAVSLAAILLCRGRARLVALAAAGFCGAGVWVSGGRTPFLLSTLLIGVAVIAPSYWERRPALTRTVPIVAVGLALVTVLTMLFPQLWASRLGWYRGTLDPRSTQNEWAQRWDNYTKGIVIGMSDGGLLGNGTGQESVGKPYLFGGKSATYTGLYTTESGYGSVAVEWGLIGLTLWIVWTSAWLARLVGSVRLSRGEPVAGVGLVFTGWLFLFLVPLFFTGYQAFQNFLANAYFWFLSGIVFALPLAARRLRGSASAEPVEVVPAGSSA